MKLISHRGNIFFPLPSKENKQSYIQEAIDLGYDVEIDIRMIDGELYLGHDSPDYKVSIEWLESVKNNVWIHVKNFEALNFLIGFHWARIFYHKTENHTIINNTDLIWSHDLKEAKEKSIIPLLGLEDIEKWTGNPVYGICSDYINKFKPKED